MPVGRATRLLKVVERDGGQCTWCGRPFTALVRATTDHLVPRIKGGPSWLENEVAACRRCNSERGHASPTDWMEECERRGWHPDPSRIIGLLTTLERAIRERGGQRRARPYVGAQLRRLHRRVT